jgi:hypothetical protein
MKTIFTILTILATNALVAQCDTSRISTNPAKPINTNLNILMENTNKTINPYRNIWNWGAYSGTNFNTILLNMNAGFTLNNFNGVMFSPFSNNMPSEYNYLNQNGALPQNCDIHWQDGWELMYMNLGFFPNKENINTYNSLRILESDPQSPNTNAHNDIPYFMLYNRYNGKLRFFGNNHLQFSNTTNNSLGIMIGDISQTPDNQQRPVSGVFRHVGNYDRALDQKTIHTYASSQNRNPNNNNVWMSTDFQLGFDPCVCVIPTTWELEARLVTEWDVDLYGRSVSHIANINAYGDDFLSNHSIKEKGGSGGSLLYKSFDKMYQGYETSLQNYETKLAKYNRIQSQVTRELVSLSKGLIKDGVMAAVNPSLLATKLLDSTLKKILPKIDSKKAGEAAKKGTDMLLGKGLDFLSKQIVNPDVLNKPVKPTMPTATFTEMRINGKFKKDSPVSLTGLYNPGSFQPLNNQLTSNNYPIYNKPVGMFALLRTPSLKFAHIKANSSKLTWKDLSSGPEKTSISYQVSDIRLRKTTKRITPFDLVAELKYDQKIYFRLNENLIYKLNHTLDFDFKKTNVFVSFLVELESSSPMVDYYSNETFDINPGERKVNISEGNLSVFQHYIRLDDTTTERLILQTDWEDISNSGNLLFGGKLSVEMNKKIANGELVKEVHEDQYILGGTYTSDETVQLNYKNFVVTKYEYDNLRAGIIENSQFKIKKVTMKLMPDMYFKQVNSVGGQTNTTQSFTYLLFDADKNIDLIKDNGEWLNSSNVSTITKYNLGKLVLNNETISPNKPYVKLVQGNKIVIDQEYVEITGNTSVANGYTAEINAFYKIEVKSNATVSPKISLNIKQDYFNMPKTIEASQDYVNSFCSGLNKKSTKLML